MTRPSIYISRRLPEAVHAMLEQHFECEVWEQDSPVPRAVLLEKAARCDGLLSIVTERIDDELLDAAPRLKIVANYAVGFDNIDVPACTRHGVLASNTPGVLTETTADLAFALILAAGRRVTESERFVKSGSWRAWSPFMMTGRDIHGATLGLIGLGRIGSAVARRARGFNMNLVYSSPTRKPEAEAELGLTYLPMDELLKSADFVSIHAPLTESTRNLIAARELGLMKPTAVLVNTARGGIVNEQDLYTALRDGTIFAAGLDVFAQEPVPMSNPLLALENCVTLPHIGSATVATRTRMGTLAAENLIACFTGKKPPTLINPELWEQRQGKA